ncbi:hypothetical protein GL177_10305 [Vibrio toranzoniae]|uniref:hypothetical protein n=1 Tax=Vibrio toranzoniae TaxID=1194427 RepID=UPI0013782F6D|nr:hypothetical protein [Vibrio toranzoniae]NAZ53743.1 hypothetical protein [Vibrio toranzoniae]
MRFINKVFYKLSDIDTKVSMKDKLKTCLELDIPLLVDVPNGYNVWSIDKQLDELTRQDVVLSESDYSKKIMLMHHLLEGEYLSRVNPPKINTLFLGASTLVAGVEYLQVTESDTKKLLASENITTDTFKGVVTFDDKEQRFALNESIPVSPYDFKLGSNTDNGHPIMQKIKNGMSNSRFVLCDKATRSNNDFNFPIGSELNLSVSLLEVVIRESDVSKLVFNDKDYQQSAYYLEPEYHASTALRELSNCGYALYVKNTSVVSGGCSGYLFRNFKSFKKKGEREAGAFLIKDKTGKNFNLVKEVYSHHWLSDTKLSKKNVQEIARNVLDELHEVLDTNDTYIHAIELIIRPDKYKKLK